LRSDPSQEEVWCVYPGHAVEKHARPALNTLLLSTPHIPSHATCPYRTPPHTHRGVLVSHLLFLLTRCCIPTLALFPPPTLFNPAWSFATPPPPPPGKEPPSPLLPHFSPVSLIIVSVPYFTSMPLHGDACLSALWRSPQCVIKGTLNCRAYGVSLPHTFWSPHMNKAVSCNCSLSLACAHRK